MTKEKSQYLFMGLVGLVVLLIGAAVCRQSWELREQDEKLDRLMKFSLQQQTQSVATAPAHDQIQIAPKGTMVATTSSATNHPAPSNDAGNDAGAAIVSGDFSAWIPLDWSAKKTGAASWDLIDDNTGSGVGSVSCPAPITGFEAWDITTSSRKYVHAGKQLYAGKWIGKPSEGMGGTDWLALVWGGSPDAQAWGGHGCLMQFTVSTPPTQDQLSRIETIYQMIR